VTGTCAFALVTSAVTIGQKAAAAVVAGSTTGYADLDPNRGARIYQARMAEVDRLLRTSIARASRWNWGPATGIFSQCFGRAQGS
jgi:hypothetical protein